MVPIFWPPNETNWLTEKTLMLGKTEGRKRREQRRMRWLDGITDSMDMSSRISRSWWWTGRPGVLKSIVSQRVRHDWVTELNWTGELTWLSKEIYSKMFIIVFTYNTKVKMLNIQLCPTLGPHELLPTRLLCPWDFPHMNTGMGSHSILQGIFPTQGLNPGLLHCRQILYHLSLQVTQN